MKGGRNMHTAINNARKNLLATQLGGVCIGCLLCIVLSKIIFGGNTQEVQMLNSKILLFAALIGIYVVCYFATLRGFFARKIKALRGALDTMLHTDEEKVTVEHTGLFGHHIHGEYYKDRLGLIHYNARPRLLKAKIMNKLDYIVNNNKKLIPVIIGATAALAIILVMRL